MFKLTVEQARKIVGLSQREMAKKLGMSVNTYINKEKGVTKFFVDEAVLFAQIVNMPLENIIFLERMCQNNGK